MSKNTQTWKLTLPTSKDGGFTAVFGNTRIISFHEAAKIAKKYKLETKYMK